MRNRFTSLRRGLALAVLFAAGSLAAQAQGVGVGTTAPDASAALDIVSSTKGALLPRLTSIQRGNIANPATGLLVFQTDAPMGFYYNAGTTTTPQWQLLNPAGDNLGNHTATQALNLGTYALTGTGANLGTTRGVGIRADGGLNIGQNTTGNNIYLGYQAGQSNTTGINNQFSGYNSGLSNTTGSNNQFSGNQSGQNTTTGSNNQFSGFQSGYSNTMGSNNLFSGYQSGYSNTTGPNTPSLGPGSSLPNTTGSDNLFSGYQSGYSNTTGSRNLFSGSSSGFSNTTGIQNLFNGYNSGYRNTSGSDNLFSGAGSGYSNTTGYNNLFSGTASGQSNTTGSNNLFSGYSSGNGNTTGSNNLFSGYSSGYRNTSGNYNLFSGYSSGLANTTGSNNTAVGSNADFGAAALTNATAIGANAIVSQSNSLVLGGTGAYAVSVGIGTTAPTQKLEVAGQIFSNTGGFRFPDNTVQITAATGATGSGTTVAAGNGLSATTAAGVTTVNLGGSLTGATTIAQAGNVFSLTGGNVGIGTTTPFQKLDVSGALSSTTAGTSPLLRLSRPDNINVKYANALELSLGSYGTTGQAQSQVDFNLSNGNTDNPDMTALTLRGDGKVGIGTTTPTQPLEVTGQIFSNVGGFRFPDNTVQITAATGATGSSTTVAAANGLSATTAAGVTTVSLGGSLTGATTITQAGNAFSLIGGNVGIGTTAPTQSLDVNGGILARATGVINNQGAHLQWNRSGGEGETWLINHLGAGTANAGIRFGGVTTSGSTGPTEWARFLNNGNFGINTTAPTQKLEVAGQIFSNTGGFRFPDNTVQTTAATGVTTGDNLGNHTATQALNLGTYALTGTGANLGSTIGVGIRADGGLNIGQNTTGGNIYLGYQAGQSNTTGSNNLFSGNKSGASNTTGSNNLFSGFDSGFYNTTGSYNLFSGLQSGFYNTTGNVNLFSGFQSGANNTTGSYNLFNGNSSGYSNTTGSNNLFSGYTSGSSNTTGSNNTAVGFRADFGSAGLTNATAIGAYAVVNQSNSLVLGSTFYPVNVGIGTSSPAQKLDVVGNIQSSGDISVDDANTNAGTTNNTLRFGATGSGEAIGSKRTTGGNQYGLDFYTGSANHMSITGAGNVGIGTSAPLSGLHVDTPESGGGSTAVGVIASGGYSGNPSIELRGSGKTPYIDFVETYGVDFTTRLISSGGTLNVLGLNGPSILLNVQGGLQCIGNVNTSDQRLKEAIRPLSGALAGVLALRGVRYQWNAQGQQRGGTAHAEQVGVLAQEVEKVYPELVTTGADGYKAVNYAQLTPVLIEAMKEQQQQIETLKAQNTALQAGSANDHARLLHLQAGSADDRASLLHLQASSADDHARLLHLQAQLDHLLGADAQAHR